MDHNDRDAIEQLFDRIARVAQRSGPRDRGAEALINAKISERPAAPYYMAQTIIMQEKALNDAQARIEELEGGHYDRRGQPGPWERAAPQMGGGGFLANAAQTAMGVAGGVLLGNMLADWLTPDQAVAHEAQQDLHGGGDHGGDDGGIDLADADAGGGFGDFDIGDL